MSAYKAGHVQRGVADHRGPVDDGFRLPSYVFLSLLGVAGFAACSVRGVVLSLRWLVIHMAEKMDEPPDYYYDLSQIHKFLCHCTTHDWEDQGAL